MDSRLTKIKYCSTCDIYRPPRTVHCGVCNCCIERLDHHCPWLGTCIGKRNYKYFLAFVYLLAIMVAKGIALTCIHITDSSFNMTTDVLTRDLEDQDPQYSSQQIVSMILLGLISLLGIFVFWLLGYHQYLLCLNQTTNENLKGSFTKYGNPHNRGICDNLKRIFRKDKRNWKPDDDLKKEEAISPKRPRKTSNPRLLVRQNSNSEKKPGQQQIELPVQASEAKESNQFVFATPNPESNNQKSRMNPELNLGNF